MQVEKTFQLELINKVFEIPIYRISNEDFEAETNDRIDRKPTYAVSAEAHYLGSDPLIEMNERRESDAEGTYPWKFNEIVGWLTLHADAEGASGELFIKDAHRIVRGSRAKIRYWETAFSLDWPVAVTDQKIYSILTEAIATVQKRADPRAYREF